MPSVIGLFRDAHRSYMAFWTPRSSGNVLGIPVLGGDERIPELAGLGHPFVVTAGMSVMRHSASGCAPPSWMRVAHWPAILAPTGTVVKGATIGEGTTVGHGAVVNSNGRIGTNCIITHGPWWSMTP